MKAEAIAEEASVDPSRVAILRYALETIAEEMHATVVRTGRSTNIKDREDTSSAIYDKTGNVVAQSEVATPVHLGTTHAVVARVLREFDLGALEPGDGIVMNTPYPTGPGHLNDIAVVCPVFHEGKLVGVVANQAHHVDVGGFAPGSMPFGVWEIFQEGLQIPPTIAFKNYQLDDTFWNLVAANIRDPDEVRGDLEAQFAANSLGARRLADLAEQLGAAALTAGFDAMQDYAERMMRAEITAIPDGTYSFGDCIEGDGTTEEDLHIRVTIVVEGDRLHCDFSATDAMATGPINCTPSSVTACVFYVMKALGGHETPANAGAFRPITIELGNETLLSPVFPAAVCNANIVTTQRIVDVMLGALATALPDRIGAASSGTMHLLNIGMKKSDRYATLVETFGGGQGGLPGQDGMHGIHSHMSNTRNTPVEILETTYPITVEEYALVQDSPGAGLWQGGAGIRRQYVLHEAAVITLSSDRSRNAPWGLRGGSNARPARNFLVKQDGSTAVIPSKASFTAAKGEGIVIETPGGGGYGDCHQRPLEAIAQDLRWQVLSEDYVTTNYPQFTV